jgi:hypothetical protein
MYWHALPEGWQHLSFDDFLTARRKRMALVGKDAMTRLTDVIYKPDYAGPGVGAASDTDITEASELRSMVDADLLPSGITLVTGDEPEQHLAQVLLDGRLYADGETYDGLIELSDVLGFQATRGRCGPPSCPMAACSSACYARRLGYVHFLATRRRCQRRIVPGVIKRCPRSILGRAGPARRTLLDPPSPAELRVGSAQHSDFVTQHQEFDVLGRRRAAE